MLSTRLAFAAATACSLAACTAPLPTTNPSDLTSPRPGFVLGYLPTESLVDSLALLPPPPMPGSERQADDDAVYRASRRWQNTPRWRWAEHDAELSFPKAAEAFSCALGIPINPEATPHLNMLLVRTSADAGLATQKAKDHYKRARPFMAEGDAICTPNAEAVLRKDGSYPSGHAARGWALALVLTELEPEHADALAQRGYEYGQSRVVCGVHWQSDVDAGRLIGSAVAAQLHANAEFTAQFGAARAEVAAARTTAAKPTVDCTAEAKALAR